MDDHRKAVVYGLLAAASFAVMGVFVFSAIFGFAIWSEVPDRLSLLGGLLILSAALLVFVRARGRYGDPEVRRS